MIASGLVYLGLAVAILGTLSVLRPLAFAGLPTRGRSAAVVIAGFLIIIIGFTMPASEKRISAVRTELDRFVPVYQFNEVHSIQIAAPRERVYKAIKTVTADDILFFRTLTWIRRFGHSGKESILNAPPHQPLLEVAMRGGFITLSEQPGQEIVFGTVVVAPRRIAITPDNFTTISDHGIAKAGMNFLIQDGGANSLMLTTETRVYATDAASRHKFSNYWRIIYPGSALIRLMWLRAVKHRAEMPEL